MDWTVAAAPGIIRITRPGAKGAIQPLLIYLMVLDDPNLEDAFRAFFHRYSALALRVARRYLDEHLAQDAVQNSFIAAARRFSVLMEWDEARRKRYFLVTVRNCAIDLLRREREYTGLEEGEPLPGGLSGEQAAQAAAGYDALVEVILSMPPAYREVLERRLVLEQSPDEVASAMGLTRAAVNARFSRGRKLLQEKLLEEGILP